MTNSSPAPDAGSDALALVPEALRGAIEARGYTSLTPVQQAVLAAEPGRDLRVSSQTGSGKTVAFGLVIGRTLPTLPAPTAKGPRVLVMAPTRELAQQVRHELAWLLSPLNVRVLSVTGGTSVRGDLVALRQGADVVVGTPGRLADHVRSGAVACDDVAMVILDEADEMLDMGFADELAAVLDKVPAQRSMHLVSATFASAVLALANRYQRNALPVMGTPPGDANADIDHVIHFVARDERLDALVNLLLLAPGEPTLIFTRTREGAAELVRLLREMDLGALLLTGDLDQQERQRTLELFRSGRMRVLVATDVAARGLDVPGITRVIHTDPPEDPDAYTHRSGRTGRAGRKGASIMLLPREARLRTLRLLDRAGIEPRVAPVPGADEILRAFEERVLAAVTDEDPPADEPTARLARRLLESLDAQTLVARLLSRPIPQLTIEPRTVTPVAVDARRKPAPGDDRPARPRRGGDEGPGDFVRFQVSWGAQQGADARRVLALLCRRGGVTRDHVGPIVVGQMSSFVDIRGDVADAFEAAAQKPDPRDPRVRVRRAIDSRSERPARPARPEADDARPARPALRPALGGDEAPRGKPARPAEAPAKARPSLDAEAPDSPRPAASEAPAAAADEAAVPAAPRPRPSRKVAEAEAAAPPKARASRSRADEADDEPITVPRPRASRSKAAEAEAIPAPRASRSKATEAEAPAAPAPRASRSKAAEADDEPITVPKARASRSKAAEVEVIPAPRASRSKAAEAAPKDDDAPARRPARPDLGAATERKAARGDDERPLKRPAFERPQAAERPARRPYADRPHDDRPARPYDSGRPSPAGRHDRPAPAGRYDRADRPAPAGRYDRPAPAGRHDRSAPAGRHDRPAPAGRHDRAERPSRYERPAAPERPASPAPADRPARRVVVAPGNEPAGEKKPKRKKK